MALIRNMLANNLANEDAVLAKMVDLGFERDVLIKAVSKEHLHASISLRSLVTSF